jgi:hypothetical protein
MKLIIMQFLPTSCQFILHLFRYSPSCSLNIRDKVSHPYKSTGKIMGESSASGLEISKRFPLLSFLLLLPLWSVGLISQFLDHFTDGRTPWTGDQLVARPLPIHRTTQTQENAHTHTKHPCSKWDSKPRSRLPSERRHYMP